MPISKSNFQCQFPIPISNAIISNSIPIPKRNQPLPDPGGARRAYHPVMSRLPWFTHGQEVRSATADFFLRWQAIVRIAVDPNFPCSAMRRMRANTQSDSGRMKRNYNECTA